MYIIQFAVSDAMWLHQVEVTYDQAHVYTCPKKRVIVLVFHDKSDSQHTDLYTL